MYGLYGCLGDRRLGDNFSEMRQHGHSGAFGCLGGIWATKMNRLPRTTSKQKSRGRDSC